jgi:hypothetical protein
MAIFVKPNPSCVGTVAFVAVAGNIRNGHHAGHGGRMIQDEIVFDIQRPA